MNEIRPFAPFYLRSQYTSTGQGTSSLAFQGQQAPSVTVAASGAAASSTRFPGTPSNSIAYQIQIANLTDKWAFVNFGDVANLRAATLTDYPVGPGMVQVVTVDPEVSGASVILTGAAGGSTSVIFTRGSGS